MFIALGRNRIFSFTSDLVQAKKTQGYKDWPMLRRVVKVNDFANRENPTQGQSVSGISNCGRRNC